MTDREFAHHAPRFERDVNTHGLRAALESFLDHYSEYRPRFDGMLVVRSLSVAVATKYGVTLKQIRSLSRTPIVTRARREVWCRLCASGYSVTQIAEWWHCDHSSVVAGRRVVREREPALFAEIEATRERPGLRLVADERQAA